MQTSMDVLPSAELEALYLGLCALVDSPHGTGYFHNADRGHPVYAGGAHGRPGGFAYADGPETNKLFILGHSLHSEICRRSPRFFEHDSARDFPTTFANWESFCAAAMAAHTKSQLQRQGLQ